MNDKVETRPGPSNLNWSTSANLDHLRGRSKVENNAGAGAGWDEVEVEVHNQDEFFSRMNNNLGMFDPDDSDPNDYNPPSSPILNPNPIICQDVPRHNPIQVPLCKDHNFQPIQPPSDPILSEDQSEADQLTFSLPPPYIYNEVPAIWLAYLGAVIGHIYGHLSVIQVKDQHNNSFDVLLASRALPDLPRPVWTLVSTKQRLSINPDQWVISYTLCPVCWKYHSPLELEKLNSPNCTVPSCEGIIYIDTQGAKQ